MRKLLFVVALLMLLPLAHTGADEDTDLLIYKLDNFDGKPSLMLYDPTTDTTTALLIDTDFGSYSLSVDGYLAYSLTEGDQQDIFIGDVHSLNQSPVNITQTQDINERVLSWSPDGQYLAFATFFSEQQLYVRDEDNQPLLTVEGQSNPAWSANGDLIFCGRNRQWALSVWNGETITQLGNAREIDARWQSGSGVNCSSG